MRVKGKLWSSLSRLFLPSLFHQGARLKGSSDVSGEEAFLLLLLLYPVLAQEYIPHVSLWENTIKAETHD